MEEVEHMKKVIGMLLCVLILVTCMQGCMGTEAIVFEDYQGPVLSLGCTVERDEIEVDRYIECDYSKYNYSLNSNRKVKINDRYILRNTSNEDVVMELASGFVADYATEISMVPKIEVNGNVADTKLVVGRSPLRYGFGMNGKGYYLYNRECFENLLADGIYKKEALDTVENVPILQENVTVYKFETVGYPIENDKDALPCVKILFSYDSEKTDIFSYGMNTCVSKNDVTTLGFNVPQKGERGYGKSVYLIVAGEEIHIQDIKYYSHQLSNRETDKFSLDYTKYETTLEDVFQEIIDLYSDKYHKTSEVVYGKMTNEQILNVGKQYIVDVREWGNSGEKVLALEDYLFKEYSDWRVFYEITELTVPANESVEVLLEYEKYVGIKNIEGEKYDGIEIMTNLDSNLQFESQMLKVVGMDGLKLSEYTTGEALENGKYEVEMTDEYFEIYLEVSEKECD